MEAQLCQKLSFDTKFKKQQQQKPPYISKKKSTQYVFGEADEKFFQLIQQFFQQTNRAVSSISIQKAY